MNLAENEKELDDGGNLECAQNYVEVSGYYGGLDPDTQPFAVSLLTLTIIFDECIAVDCACDGDYARTHVKNCQRDQSDLSLLDQDTVEVHGNEDEDEEVDEDLSGEYGLHDCELCAAFDLAVRLVRL